MSIHINLAAAFLLLLGMLVLTNITPASARGGGSNIMNSPGYQRALQESRQRYLQSAAQPNTQPAAVHRRKTSRHHAHR